MKPTLVFAASPKPDRYSNMAIKRLLDHGHEVIPVGFRKADAHGLEIRTDFPKPESLHTVTLYLNPRRQVEHYDYIISLQPQRIIFNPGTENLELQRLAEAAGIETTIACTLVMLSIGNY